MNFSKSYPTPYAHQSVVGSSDAFDAFTGVGGVEELSEWSLGEYHTDVLINNEYLSDATHWIFGLFYHPN